MKQRNRFFLLATAAAMMLLTAATGALAAGTAASTSITNQATLDYQVGGIDQPQVLSDNDADPNNGINSTDFVVDAKVDLTMNAPTASVTPGATGQVLLFTLQNTGNQTQGYSLELFTGVDATDDDFDMNPVKVYYDDDDNGSYDGTEPEYTLLSGDNIADVAAGATIKILVVADVPLAALNGETAQYTLKATTLDAGTTTVTAETGGADTAGVDTVFGDGDAGAGVNSSTDGAENGQFLGNGTFTVQSATLSVVKSAAIISDPFNDVTDPKAIPGAIIEYTIDITNNGATDATTVVLADPIPANTAYVVGSLTAAGGALDYLDGTDTSVAESATIAKVQVTFATVTSGGGTAQVKFRVEIQ